MPIRQRVIVWSCLLHALGCSTSDRFADGGPQDGGSDRDGAPADGGDSAGARFGAECERASDCGRNLFCDTEVDLTSRLPSGDEVPGSAFPGGVCTPVPAAPFDPDAMDSCDPFGPPSHQGCGANGVCVGVAVSSMMSVLACRPACEPKADASGCDRDFYTCDFDLRACVEGCLSDVECQIQLVDTNGDGRPEPVVDEDSEAFCDLTTYRCTHRGGGTAETGDACERTDDCEPDGTCIQALQSFADMRFPDGTCTKVGCDVEGRECTGDDAACERLRPLLDPGLITPPVCLDRCTVGAEPEEDRVGPDGHGEGCREGYRCHYNGGSGAESGVCVGGNYNDVAADNLGAVCEADSACYSPYGMGACLLLGVDTIQPQAGSCSILDCNAPGVPDDICGPNGECIGLIGDVTFCVRTCTEAEQCGEGYACSDDDGDPTTSRICYPACFGDDDCRKGTEVCALSATSTLQRRPGACVASED